MREHLKDDPENLILVCITRSQTSIVTRKSKLLTESSELEIDVLEGIIKKRIILFLFIVLGRILFLFCNSELVKRPVTLVVHSHKWF